MSYDDSNLRSGHPESLGKVASRGDKKKATRSHSGKARSKSKKREKNIRAKRK